jgi:hypothetical protein
MPYSPHVQYALALQMRIAINEGRSYSVWSPDFFDYPHVVVETPNFYLPCLLNGGSNCEIHRKTPSMAPAHTARVHLSSTLC